MSIPPTLAPYVPLSFREGGKADGALLSTISEADATRVAQGVMERSKNLPPAAAQLFRAMVDAADLAPGVQIPENVDAALDALGEAVTLVSSLSVSSADLDFLARALLEQTAAQRHEALQQRVNAREYARADLMAQAGEMRQQADDMKNGAIVSVVLSTVSAAVSLIGGALSLHSTGKTLKQTNEAASNMELALEIDAFKPGTSVAQDLRDTAKTLSESAQATGNKVQAVNSILSGVGQSVGSFGGMGKSLYESSGKYNEAEGAQAAAEAQTKAAVGDMAKEVQTALDDMVRAIINFLKELQEARSQQMQAFTRV